MMEPSRHDNAMSNVRVGPPWAMWGWALTPPYSQLKDIYLFIYLFNKDWGFFFNKMYNYKDTLHKARGIFSSPRSFPII
jgi:hypothetical protein